MDLGYDNNTFQTEELYRAPNIHAAYPRGETDHGRLAGYPSHKEGHHHVLTSSVSTAIQVDQYAAFANVPADDVVNKALEYVFTKDRDFQQFRETNPNEKAPAALRIKKPIIAAVGAKRGRKPSLVAAD